jgi:hypothetical protein
VYDLNSNLDRGATVTFQAAGDGRYECLLVPGDGDPVTAYGASPGEALWNASPLRLPEQSYPGDSDLDRLAESVRRVGHTLRTIEVLWAGAFRAGEDSAAGRLGEVEKRVRALENAGRG